MRVSDRFVSSKEVLRFTASFKSAPQRAVTRPEGLTRQPLQLADGLGALFHTSPPTRLGASVRRWRESCLDDVRGKLEGFRRY